MSSCCGGNCTCGSDCKCDSGGGGCKMYPDVSPSEKSTTATVVPDVAPGKSDSGEPQTERAAVAENGCKCGPNCSCNPCTCK